MVERDIYDYTVTRGDSFILDFNLEDRDFNPSDTVIFSIKKEYADSEYAAQKTVTGLSGDSGTIEFTSSEMNLQPGIYVYDFKIKAYNGEVVTFCSGQFIIKEAVEYEN